ncbi:MAG: hypothetical protein R3F46_11295 [bacterium]
MADFVPQGPLFDSARSGLQRSAERFEKLRGNASYVAASLLALPAGLLPWVLLTRLSMILSMSAGQAGSSLLPGSASDGPWFGLAMALSLVFIVISCVLADRVMQRMQNEASRMFAQTDLGFVILEGSLAREIAGNLRFSVMPEVLSLPPEGSTEDQMRFYALFHSEFHRRIQNRELRPAAMVMRQDAGINLLIALITGLLCLVLVGYLLLPFAIIRIFRNWPRVSACQLAFAQYMSRQESSELN